MRRLVVLAVALVIFATAGGCARPLPRSMYQALADSGAKVITVDDIKKSLPEKTIIAGFDIDDTVLFSSPGFYYGMTNRDGPGGTNLYGKDYGSNPKFWEDFNLLHDKYSVPKKIGKKIVDMHRRRGDTLVFITARPCKGNEDKVIAERLNNTFSLIAVPLVVCTPEGEKVEAIEKNRLEIFYGDSDSDIRNALDVRSRSVRPIRVVRSPTTTNDRSYSPGLYGEEILLDSDN